MTARFGMRGANYEVVDYILPTGESMNPAHPETSQFYDTDQVAIVLFKLNEKRTRPTRVLTSFGDPGWLLGAKYSLFHDQTGAFLGDYEVVGLRSFKSGQSVGNIPDMSLKHSVFK